MVDAKNSGSDPYTADSDTYVEEARDPDKWFHKSDNLLLDYQILKDRFDAVKKDLRPGRPDDTRDEAGYRIPSILGSMEMLLGLSLENSMKGYLLATRPGDVEISVSLDGRGEIKEAALTEIGGSDLTHNLSDLFNATDLYEVLRNHPNPIIEDDSELEVVEGTLDHLTHAVRWAGRYPVPRHSSETKSWLENAERSERLPMPMELYRYYGKKLIQYINPPRGYASDEHNPQNIPT